MSFQEHSGFDVQAARNWIGTHLPKCPFCQRPSLWQLKRKIGWKALLMRPSADRVYYRCPHCMSIVSIATEAISPNVREPLAFIVKKIINKNLKIERVDSEKQQHLIGKEFPLSVLQEWADQKENNEL